LSKKKKKKKFSAVTLTSTEIYKCGLFMNVDI
jgi:hypothetical protein